MEPTQSDILISRIADDEATTKDWAEFETLAGLEPDVWERLARQQRDCANLRSAVGRQVNRADAVELTLHHAGPGAERAIAGRIGAWGGWAIAAAVALAWLGIAQAPLFDGSMDGEIQHAGITMTPVSADDALEQYRVAGEREGRYLGELPKVMVEARPTGDPARIEVLYLRQILEREVVGGVFGIGEDDQGRVQPIPIQPRVIEASDPI